jgi:hypothetical protein
MELDTEAFYPTRVRSIFEPSDETMTIIQDGEDGIKVVSAPLADLVNSLPDHVERA